MCETCLNTDKEIWREKPGDFYSDSIHVTQGGGVGINCGGTVIVAPVQLWHRCGNLILCNERTSWKYRLAIWLLKRVTASRPSSLR
jgi:hypothetical protein